MPGLSESDGGLGADQLYLSVSLALELNVQDKMFAHDGLEYMAKTIGSYIPATADCDLFTVIVCACNSERLNSLVGVFLLTVCCRP